jgi:hypothetical protein
MQNERRAAADAFLTKNSASMSFVRAQAACARKLNYRRCPPFVCVYFERTSQRSHRDVLFLLPANENDFDFDQPLRRKILARHRRRRQC